MKSKNRAYLIYRVLTRLNEQSNIAMSQGRFDDAHSIGLIIGRLEYQHFHVVGFEDALILAR
jgi:hypothetical protein